MSNPTRRSIFARRYGASAAEVTAPAVSRHLLRVGSLRLRGRLGVRNPQAPLLRGPDHPGCLGAAADRTPPCENQGSTDGLGGCGGNDMSRRAVRAAGGCDTLMAGDVRYCASSHTGSRTSASTEPARLVAGDLPLPLPAPRRTNDGIGRGDVRPLRAALPMRWVSRQAAWMLRWRRTTHRPANITPERVARAARTRPLALAAPHVRIRANSRADRASAIPHRDGQEDPQRRLVPAQRQAHRDDAVPITTAPDAGPVAARRRSSTAFPSASWSPRWALRQRAPGWRR